MLRGFRDVTVNGLAFSTMADSTAGGRQVDGFHGISIEYMRSGKFMHADGGYDRVVWMPSRDKRATQGVHPANPCTAALRRKRMRPSIPRLREFLEKHHHPVTARWTGRRNPLDGDLLRRRRSSLPATSRSTVGGFRIILKNARITADKVIIQPVKPGQRHGRRSSMANNNRTERRPTARRSWPSPRRSLNS